MMKAVTRKCTYFSYPFRRFYCFYCPQHWNFFSNSNRKALLSVRINRKLESVRRNRKLLSVIGVKFQAHNVNILLIELDKRIFSRGGINSPLLNAFFFLPISSTIRSIFLISYNNIFFKNNYWPKQYFAIIHVL